MPSFPAAWLLLITLQIATSSLKPFIPSGSVVICGPVRAYRQLCPMVPLNDVYLIMCPRDHLLWALPLRPKVEFLLLSLR